MRHPAGKTKTIVFEKLNLFSFILAVVYCKIGFNVMYFVIDGRLKESGYFKRVAEKHSIDKFPAEQFDFNTEISLHGYALKNTGLLYKFFFERNSFLKTLTRLFKSDSIHLVYKKILSEKLYYFYYYQTALNDFAKRKGLKHIYYVSSDFVNFMHLLRHCPLVDALDKDTKLVEFPLMLNSLFALYEKISQLLLLMLWPLVLIKDVKKITFARQSLEKYKVAIRIYKTGFNFESGVRNIDFLLDGKDITRDNALFCIETEIDKDFREGLKRRQYHFVDIPNILRELNWRFIKRVYFAMLLPVWSRLCLLSILQPAFVIRSYRGVFGLYLRWSAFLDKYEIKNFVAYNDFCFPHIIRNILLSQRGIETWYYAHSSHSPDLFGPPYVGEEVKWVPFSHIHYDNFVSWGKQLASFYMKQPNSISKFVNIGCLWSEEIRKIAETNCLPDRLKHIYAKYKQKGTDTKKIIGVFDTSFGRSGALTVPLTFYDMKCFLDGILKLADARKDLIFIVKPKNSLENIMKNTPEIIPYYREMTARSEFYVFEDLCAPSFVIGMCDMTVSACFTSTLNEALGYQKKAVYFDGAARFKGYYYDHFPNLIAHGYDELVKIVDYWLYDMKDEEFSDYISNHVKGELDPYADGFAITRFRELLTR